MAEWNVFGEPDNARQTLLINPQHMSELILNSGADLSFDNAPNVILQGISEYAIAVSVSFGFMALAIALLTSPLGPLG